jgi:hypothetical protein
MPNDAHDQVREAEALVVAFPVHSRRSARWEPWLGESVIARHYGVSTRTIRRWRGSGMPSRAFGGSRRYRLSECESWHDLRRSA